MAGARTMSISSWMSDLLETPGTARIGSDIIAAIVLNPPAYTVSSMPCWCLSRVKRIQAVQPAASTSWEQKITQ